MIIRSDWRGEPRNTSAPKRAISKREALIDIISMAQHASPKDMGQMEFFRAQLMALSSVVRITPSEAAERSCASLSMRANSSGGPLASGLADIFSFSHGCEPTRSLGISRNPSINFSRRGAKAPRNSIRMVDGSERDAEGLPARQSDRMTSD